MSPPAPSAGFPDPGTIRAAERSGNRPLFSVSVHRRRPNKRSPENPPNRKRTRLGLSLRHAPCDRVFTDRQPPGNRPQSHPRESLRLTRPDYSLPQRRSPVARRRDPVGRADRDRAHGRLSIARKAFSSLGSMPSATTPRARSSANRSGRNLGDHAVVVVHVEQHAPLLETINQFRLVNGRHADGYGLSHRVGIRIEQAFAFGIGRNRRDDRRIAGVDQHAGRIEPEPVGQRIARRNRNRPAPDCAAATGSAPRRRRTGPNARQPAVRNLSTIVLLTSPHRPSSRPSASRHPSHGVLRSSGPRYRAHGRCS